ncbi:complement factor H [Caretta caretta]|uniref:complement factor H n=1 Tax=Caretta caretta TaxID=8467 RepID=UPI003F4C9C51
MISLQKQLLRTECREAQNSTSAIASTGFNWSTLRMTLLSCIIIQILWAFSAKGQAPCSLTKQQLETKNLLLSNGQRHAQLIQSDHTLEFMCSEGYTLTTSSVRKCVNGHMDLPLCISERGKNCSRPPTIENGDITTFLEKGYTAGSFVEFKCQKFYAMEGQNRSFCDNGNWTKAPLCLEPCAISVEEMENQMVELNGRANETILQWMYLKRGDFLELRCKPGYALATNLSQSTFMVQCHGNPIVYPECKEIVCDPPEVVNGRFRPQRNVYRDGDVLIITCNRGFHTNNDQDTAECTKNGWLPPPWCSMRLCDYPHIENGALTDYYEHYKERAFPAQLGVSIYYRCLDGYVSEREERWPLIRCTKAGWSPAPKCLKKCSPGHLENGKFIFNSWTTYKERDEISYVCFPENLQAKVTCTKNGWSPTPRCTS